MVSTLASDIVIADREASYAKAEYDGAGRWALVVGVFGLASAGLLGYAITKVASKKTRTKRNQGYAYLGGAGLALSIFYIYGQLERRKQLATRLLPASLE